MNLLDSLTGKKRVRELEAENASLTAVVQRLNGLEVAQVARVIETMKAEVATLEARAKVAKQEAEDARAKIIETDELAILQEVGIYRYRHPLDDAVAYQSRLKDLKDAMKTLVSGGRAVDAVKNWTVNGSAKEGERMTRDLSKLMLRAYNAEADNIVRTLRPHTLQSATARLAKARETIASLGKIMSIRITDDYHRWRILELELTADHMVKVEEEKERLREERAQQREEERALREMEAERKRLEKEQNHYLTALEKARNSGNAAAVQEYEAKLQEIGANISGIENREANIRTGYVYVISNFGSFGEHVVKIGMTRRLEPMDRIRELGDASVPFNFDVHALIFSEDAVGLENRLHQNFADRRLNTINLRREYFFVTPHEVLNALQTIAGQQLLEFREVPEATEWRTSGGSERLAQLLALRSATTS